MDCFHDFCVACDKVSVDGPYCSQACRMLDLEKGSHDISPPTSPRSEAHPRWSSSASAYVLAPAYNFEQDRLRDSHTRSRSSTTEKVTTFTTTVGASVGHTLSPSSSRTSLSSTSSMASPGGLSEQARAELQGYFSSFDQLRTARRRSSLR